MKTKLLQEEKKLDAEEGYFKRDYLSEVYEKKYYELLNQLKKLENILKEREEKIKLLNKRKGFLGNILQRLIK